MDACDQAPLKSPKMQDQQLLMLSWRSFSRSGREHVSFCFSHKGSQYFTYDCLQLITTQSTQDARPGIVDAPLMLFLPWRSFSSWGREPVPSSFSFKGGQYIIYDCLQPITTQIDKNGRHGSVDAPLTLIWPGHIVSWWDNGECHFLLFLYRRPILHFWLSATNHHSDYQIGKTWKCWHSVDTPFAREYIFMMGQRGCRFLFCL